MVVDYNCRGSAAGRRKSPESHCDFVPQDIDGEGVMRRDCPAFGGGFGGPGRADKAVEGFALLTDFIDVMQCAFLDLDLTHDLDRFVCTEIGRNRVLVGVCSRASKAVEDNRSPSPGGTAERRETEGHPWGLRRWAIEAGVGIAGWREIPESRCGFILHEADGEWLMRKECPAFARQKRDFSTRICRWRRSAAEVEMPELPESRCDFDLQDTVGELVMSHACPEFGGGGVKVNRMKCSPSMV